MISKDVEKFEYNFSLDEIQVLLSFFRTNPNLNDKLNNFFIALEKYVYSIMSIDEAEEFFK